MKSLGILGSSVEFTRRFPVGATLKTGQIVCIDASNLYAMVGSPASATSYAKAVGINLDAVPSTYSTTQGTGASSAFIAAECTYHPFQLFSGRVSSAATYAALTAVAGGALLTNSTASTGGTVVSDTNVGTGVYTGGVLVGLTGNNAGLVRTITSQSNGASNTVSVPFDYTIAAGDTFLRTFNMFMEGVGLTTLYTDFLTTATGGTMPGTITGGTLIMDVLVDGSYIAPKRGQSVNVINPTAPLVEIVGLFADHVFNKLS